jgi:hypothetical protein
LEKIHYLIAWRREIPKQPTAAEERQRLLEQQRELEEQLKEISVGRSWAEECEEMDYSKDPFEAEEPVGDSLMTMEERVAAEETHPSQTTALKSAQTKANRSDSSMRLNADSWGVGTDDRQAETLSNINSQNDFAANQKPIQNDTASSYSQERTIPRSSYQNDELGMEFPSAATRCAPRNDWRSKPLQYESPHTSRYQQSFKSSSRHPPVETITWNVTVKLTSEMEPEIVPVRLPKRE